MKSIETRYLGPTNFRGSRIIATDGDRRVVMPYRHELEPKENHKATALELIRRCWRTGPLTLAGGDTKNGMVWVIINVEHRNRHTNTSGVVAVNERAHFDGNETE